MDWFLIFLAVVITILSLVLITSGVYVILILRNLNKNLDRLNKVLQLTETLASNLTNPVSDVKSLTQGVKTGVEVASQVVTWIKQRNTG